MLPATDYSTNGGTRSRMVIILKAIFVYLIYLLIGVDIFCFVCCLDKTFRDGFLVIVLSWPIVLLILALEGIGEAARFLCELLKELLGFR